MEQISKSCKKFVFFESQLRLRSSPVFFLVQVASFPFKGNTSFLVVLPRGNVSSVLPRLNISDLYRRLPQETTTMVSLPKVKLEFRQELEEALTKTGEGRSSPTAAPTLHHHRLNNTS